MEWLQFEFLRNAVIMGLLASIALGPIGTLVVVNRQVFIGGGIAHAAYGGVGIAFFFGISPVLGALSFSVFAALSMGIVERVSHQRSDTVIGVIWAIGMAIGIAFVDRTPGYKADLMSFLFGSILAVSQQEILFMIILDAVVVGFVALFYRPLAAFSFDETFARVRNLPVVALHLALLCVVAVTVVLLMRVVGLILVIAMLTMPVAVSTQFVRTLRATMLSSVILAAVFTLVGLWLSLQTNLTSSATIILVSATGFVFGIVAQRLRAILMPARRESTKEPLA